MKKIYLALLVLTTLFGFSLSAQASLGSENNSTSTLTDIQDRLSRIDDLTGVEGSLVIEFSGSSDTEEILNELDNAEESLSNGEKINQDEYIHLACRNIKIC